MLYAIDIFYSPILTAGQAVKWFKGSISIAKKLMGVQHIAILQITGGMRTSATEMFYVHADLLPFHLLLKRICYRSVL